MNRPCIGCGVDGLLCALHRPSIVCDIDRLLCALFRPCIGCGVDGLLCALLVGVQALAVCGFFGNISYKL